MINSIDSLNISKKAIDDSTTECNLETQVMWIEWTKPISPDSWSSLQWKEMHSLYFHPQAKALDKKITLSFLKRQNGTIWAVGRERTFLLSQFDEGKIHEFEVDFQKNFKSYEKATVSVKIQYIPNEQELINRIIELYEQKRKLLSILLKKLINEVKGEQEEEQEEEHYSKPTHKKKSSQFGGWYDKWLNLKSEQSKSILSAGYTSRDQSFANESVQNESGVYKQDDYQTPDKNELERWNDSINLQHLASADDESDVWVEQRTSIISNNDEFFKVF